MDDFDEYEYSNLPTTDSRIRQFYDKLSDIPSRQWNSLQDKEYKLTNFGQLQINEVTQFADWPQLHYFLYAQARNGGPMALLTKDYVLLVGQKTPKNQIFLFDGKGRKYKTLMLETMIQQISSHTKWVCLDFNQDEDLVLMASDGRLFIIDIVHETILERQHYNEFSMGQGAEIEDSRLCENTLIVRTKTNRFSYLHNVVAGGLAQSTQQLVGNQSQFTKLKESPKLLMNAGNGEIDFIVSFKNEGNRKQVQVICTDPMEGLHRITEDFTSHHLNANIRSQGDAGAISQDFGKVKFVAYNDKKNSIAIYSNSDALGSVIVLTGDLSLQVNRQDTGRTNASAFKWCGNFCPILAVKDFLVLAGPRENVMIDLNARAEGVYFFTESDGARILTASDTFFLQLVPDPCIQAFQLASMAPAARLLDAKKQDDYQNPRADEIIRDLQADLYTGIEQLMTCAKHEENDVDVLKHILSTISFAKKYTTPEKLAPDAYVDLKMHAIIVTKMQHSKILQRAITYSQFQAFKPKNIVRLLLKYRDYGLAELLCTLLKKKQLIPGIYEDWCAQMLKFSKQNEQEIIGAFQAKFRQLSEKLAIDQGFSYTDIENCKIARDSLANANEREAPALKQLAGLLDRIKLNIDFTKLAKIAHQQNKLKVSNYLINLEPQIVKKIPFLLEVREYESALKIAVKGGDPNNINKVFTEILKINKPENVTQDAKKKAQAINFNAVIEKSSKVPEGLRHLRNFAKKRHAVELLKVIYQFVNSLGEKDLKQMPPTGLRPGEGTEMAELLKVAYEQPDIQARIAVFKQASEVQQPEKIRDKLLPLMLQEAADVTQKQVKTYQLEQGGYKIESSLASHIMYLIAKNNKDSSSLCKKLQSELKMNDQIYMTITIRAFAQAKEWNDVLTFIQMGKPLCPPAAMGEICNEFNNHELAQEGFKRVKDVEQRIELLIDFEYWKEAITQTFQHKKMDIFLDDLNMKCPPFARDYIRQEQEKMAMK